MSDRIERDDLILFVIQRTGQEARTVEVIVDAFLDEICQALKRGQGVTLKGFDGFYIRPERESWVFKFNPARNGERCLAGLRPIKASCSTRLYPWMSHFRRIAMPRKPESRGTCAYCGEVITKRSVTKHLNKCPKRLEALQSAAASSRPVEMLWHLRVQDAYDKDYWLNLEMDGTVPLEKLDKYLRAIWLECCGHLSMFTIGGWQGDEITKSRKADAVFKPGLVLRHLYDFGTTSETDIKVVDARQGIPASKHPIALLARNVMPEAVCQECGQPAKWLCIECLYEDDKTGHLCDEHVEEHPHENYGEPMPLFNSPRTGMCGYEGPAEPPF